MQEENNVDYQKDSQKNYTNIILWGFIVFLVVTNLFTVFYVLRLGKEQDKPIASFAEKTIKKETPENKTEVKNNIEVDTDGDGIGDQDEVLKYKTDPNNKDTDGDGYSDKEELEGGFNPLINQNKEKEDEENYSDRLNENEIFITWEDEPIGVDKMEFFGLSEKPIFDDEHEGEFIFENLEIYKNGIIKDGKYKGAGSYLILISEEGPGGMDIWSAIKKDNDFILLSSKMNEYKIEMIEDGRYGEYFKKFKIESDLKIVNLGIKEKVEVGDGKFIYRRTNDSRRFINNFENYEKVYKTEDGIIVYFDKNKGCLLIKGNDALVSQYNQDLEIIKLKEDITEFSGAVPHLLNIVWGDDRKNDMEYVSQNLGCGGANDCLKYSKFIKLEDLKEAGVVKNGDKVYELKNENFTEIERKESILKEFFNMANYYDKEFNQEEYNNFLISHPIIFWQDLFGNFVEFRNAEYQPAVECGKPVIYLYPEKEIDVYVQVHPSGGLAFTEPAYNEGWKVNAKPSGELYNYNDGQKYPYLFWEGRGNNYTRPQKGFVVKKEELENFLKEKLQKLGLIKKEYDEFIEFWQPKMQERNYYYITFMPKKDFDKIAPLNIYPYPDSIIRVFMDFEGLDNYVEVEEQEIITPSRDGFAVVEWGGALH